MQEIHRELNDLSLTTCRAIQSAETGFIHSFYGKIEPPHQAISVEDNLLFALSLCRLKTVEAVQEGKALLEKLLAYQNQEGQFPSYLHEFPHCFDRHRGAALLPPLVAIHRHFHHVLGLPLKGAIEKLLNALIPETPQMSLPNRFRVGGALASLGKKEGLELLDMKALLAHPSRFIPKHLGEAMSGAIMAEGNAASTLMEWMKGLWHQELLTYGGPFMRLNFSKGEKEITLYDLYMLAEGNFIPSRFNEPNLSLLKGALLFPHELKQTEVNIPNFIHKEPTFCFSWLESKGQYPFAFQWKNAYLIFSAPFADSVSCDGKGLLEIKMGKAPVMDSKDSGRELFWYLSPNVKILVNGLAATTFRVNDLITIEDQNMKIELVFEAKEGQFLGHLSKASAPTELECFGKNRFEAYSWQLLWRTISRSDSARVSIRFSYASKS